MEWTLNPFELSEAQKDLRRRARRAGREMPSGRPGRVDRRLVAALGNTGLLACLFPARAGGSGEADTTALDLCVLREGLAQSSTEAETALALQGLGAYPILQSGSQALMKWWVPEVAAGRAVGAFALTEPGAGSDAAALALVAERDGEYWRLSGEKKWISNAPDADFYVVFARTGGEGAGGVSAFVVEGGSAGLTGKPLELLAPHAIGTLHFDGVRVGPDSLLGKDGDGFSVAMQTLDLFRPSVGAFAVGMAQAALDAAVDHAQNRNAFGHELKDFKNISHLLADLATDIEAARLLVYWAAARYDAGARPNKSSAMAKLYATEVAQRVIDGAIQIHGAMALERGHLLERLYREVRATRIYEGTSEIQREIIARDIFGGPEPTPDE